MITNINIKETYQKNPFTILSPTAFIICLVDKLGIIRAIISNALGSSAVNRNGLAVCTILPVVSVNER